MENLEKIITKEMMWVMFIATYNYHKNIEINLHSEIVVKSC